MARSRSILSIDIYLLLSVLVLTTIGILFVYSSGVTATGQVVSREYIRQIIWAATGVLLMLIVTFTDYRLLERVSVVAYGLANVVLLITLFIGKVVNGARSWIGIGSFGVQPSEFAKLALVLMLAHYFSVSSSRSKSPIGFLGGLAIAGLPVLLVLAQPDLGTAMVYIPIFLFVAFAAGTPVRYVLFILGTAVLTLSFTVLPMWQAQVLNEPNGFFAAIYRIEAFQLLLGGLFVALVLSLIGWIITRQSLFLFLCYLFTMALLGALGGYAARQFLKDYQIMRLVVFLDPYVDPQGAGWNIIQSITAVGSGGPVGKGFLQGTQSHYQYLPQQSTDFIFSILAEEWGYLGAVAVFGLFFIVLLRGMYIMGNARDRFAAFTVAGVLGMVFFHVIVNIGMAIGLMPITGIPLLFLSYGGSSLWTAMMSVGILMSIYQHRYQY